VKVHRLNQSTNQNCLFPEIADRELLESGRILAPKFDKNGLITAVVSDHKSGDVLMVAHMNDEALQRTLDSGQSHFWSRSRQELWHKGATSGNIQEVREIRVDCDQDVVLLKVKVHGDASCHTGNTNCFYRRVEKANGEVTLISDAESTSSVRTQKT
jgi:phosphoribosyl-AMP cyclohydrolase